MEIMFCQLSDDELIKKMKNSCTHITCFSNREIAEQAIHENIQYNAEKIADWLWDDEVYMNEHLKIYYTHDNSVGYGMNYESKQKVMDISKSFIILKKCYFEKFQEGFYIKFAAPLIEKGGM